MSARQQLNTEVFSRALRAKYARNHEAGRLITDDGDEHGCPTEGWKAGCRVNPPLVEPMTASDIAADYVAHPDRWPLMRIEALPPEVRARVRELVLRNREAPG